MNTGLQRNVIEKRLRSKGVDLSSVDLTALIDPQLSLPENIQNIEREIRQQDRGVGRDEAEFLQQKAGKREAKNRHERRPPWDQRIDESLQAETVFRNPSEREMQKWKNNPDEFDIEGVDTRKPVAERQVAEPPQSQGVAFGVDSRPPEDVNLPTGKPILKAGSGKTADDRLLKEADKRFEEEFEFDTNLSPWQKGRGRLL